MVPVMPDMHHQHDILLSQTSTWLADASDAVADAEDKTDYWEAYVQLYKRGLAFVHDKIVDPPLQKAGFTQTWGVSIFAFTAATS